MRSRPRCAGRGGISISSPPGGRGLPEARLRSWAQANVQDRKPVVAAAARLLAAAGTLGEEEAAKRLAEIVLAKRRS